MAKRDSVLVVVDPRVEGGGVAVVTLRELRAKRDPGTEDSWLVTLDVEGELEGADLEGVEGLVPGASALVEAGREAAEVQARVGVRHRGLAAVRVEVVVPADEGGKVLGKGRAAVVRTEVHVDGEKAWVTQRLRVQELGVARFGELYQRKDRLVELHLEAEQQALPLREAAK